MPGTSTVGGADGDAGGDDDGDTCADGEDEDGTGLGGADEGEAYGRDGELTGTGVEAPDCAPGLVVPHAAAVKATATATSTNRERAGHRMTTSEPAAQRN